MTHERLRPIEELYHAAREKNESERAALLEAADSELRRHVESLLAVRATADFPDRPALENVIEHRASVLSDATITMLRAGAQLGPYRIESKLGEGGMGEVFRARGWAAPSLLKQRMNASATGLSVKPVPSLL